MSALIGQSAMVYCAGKLMEKSFELLYKSNRDQKFLWLIS